MLDYVKKLLSGGGFSSWAEQRRKRKKLRMGAGHRKGPMGTKRQRRRELRRREECREYFRAVADENWARWKRGDPIPEKSVS